MKPETPVVVDVRAVDVGYFSTKLTLGRKLLGNASTIATALFPSLAPPLPASTSMQSTLHGKPDGSVVDVVFMDDDPVSSNVKDFHVAGEIMSKPKTT